MNQLSQLTLPHPSYNLNKLQGIIGWVLPPLLEDNLYVHSNVVKPDGKHMPKKTPVARLHCAKKFCLLAAWLQKCYLSLLSSQVKMQGLNCSEHNLTPKPARHLDSVELSVSCYRVLSTDFGISWHLLPELTFFVDFWSKEERSKIFLCNRSVGFVWLFFFFPKKTLNKE